MTELTRCVTLMRMATQTALPATSPTPRLGRKTTVFLISLFVLAVAWVGYFAKYGQCDTRSQFCVVQIAGTRTELGFEWSAGPDFYYSTWAIDPATGKPL